MTVWYRLDHFMPSPGQVVEIRSLLTPGTSDLAVKSGQVALCFKWGDEVRLRLYVMDWLYLKHGLKAFEEKPIMSLGWHDRIAWRLYDKVPTCEPTTPLEDWLS